MADVALNILYVTLQPRWPGEAGHTHVTEIVEEWRGLGHTVRLVEPWYPTRHPTVLRRAWTIFQVVRQVRRELREGDQDIVYVRGHPFSNWVTTAAKARGMPVMLERNSSADELYLIRPWTRLLKPILERAVRHEIRNADMVIGVTREIVEESERLAAPEPIRSRVMSNAANVEVMRPIPDPEVSPYGLEVGGYVVFVGAMARWQGIPELLEAVESPAWPEGLRLVFCGAGPLAEEVSRTAAELPITQLGVVPYEEVPVIVSGALAGVAPVDQPPERAIGSSALKVFEYLSCGRPVVVTDVPGLRELVRDGDCGRVVPLRSPAAIAEAVRWLAEHPEEREAMGRRGRMLVAQEHSWAQRARDLSTIMADLVADDGRMPRGTADRHGAGLERGT